MSIISTALVVGVLVSIAVPKFANTRDQAYLATLRADARNLMSAQEIYYSSGDLFRYSSSLDSLETFLSHGVSARIIGGDEFGWAAVLRHEELPEIRCYAWQSSTSTPPPSLPIPDTVAYGPHCQEVSDTTRVGGEIDTGSP